MSQKSKLATILMTIGIVILASLVAGFIMSRATLSANRDLLGYHVVIGELQETLSTLKDAETGQRGYLLTGDEKYLVPHDEAVAGINQEFKTLEAQSRAGEIPSGDVAKLTDLARQKLDELRQTIVLRRTQGLPAALAMVQTDIGKNTMDSIRAAVGQMTAEQETALAQASQREAALDYYRDLVIALSTLLNLAVLVWAY